MLQETEEIIKVLGNPAELTHGQYTVPELVRATRRGFPATVVPFLLKRLAMDKSRMTDLVGIPGRTLARRIAEQGTLTPLQSDRILRVARVFVLAVDVTGDEDKAARWLRTPNAALEGQQPIELLDTDLGVQTVTTVLGRIAYGVYS